MEITNASVSRIWWQVRMVLVAVILTIGAAVFIFPFFWMISSSLKTFREVSIFPPPILPAVPQFQNYVTAFTRAPLFKYALNSAIVCTTVIVAVIVLTLMATYPSVFLEFRGKELFFLILLAPQMITGVILLLPLFRVLHKFHMLNTLPALIIPYTVMYSPFSTFLLRGYLESIPKELVESARIDGASEPWILARIIFPLARPALATVALFCFIWSWNEFLFALVYLQKPSLRTISVGIALLQSVPNFPPETNVIMAAATAVTLPVLLLFSFTQRQFIQGMTAGAVK